MDKSWIPAMMAANEFLQAWLWVVEVSVGLNWWWGLSMDSHSKALNGCNGLLDFDDLIGNGDDRRN